VALCAQPFGWRTLVEVTETLLPYEGGVQQLRASLSYQAWFLPLSYFCSINYYINRNQNR